MLFEWDDANRNHIAKHGVTTEEAEQVIRNEPIELGIETVTGEERIAHIGETDEGRILVVITTWREERVRVVTSFPANRSSRLRFATEKGKLHEGTDEGTGV